MIRPMTLVTLLAAMGAGLHLYQTKHAVALLDRDMRGLSRQITEAQERTVALAAEWAWLNEPERLRMVAQRHLKLEPMQPAQFVRLAEAERRLPAAGAMPLVALAMAEPAPAGPAPNAAPMPGARADLAGLANATGASRAVPRADPVAVRPEPAMSDRHPTRLAAATPEAALGTIPGTTHGAIGAAPPDAGSSAVVARAEVAAPRPAVRPTPRPAIVTAAAAPSGPPRPQAQNVALLPAATRGPTLGAISPVGSAVAAPIAAPTVSAFGSAGSLPPPVPFAR